MEAGHGRSEQMTAVPPNLSRAASDGPVRPETPSVRGKPLLWLRAEGLTLLATALLLFSATHQQWWLVPAVILLPDLFMAGYVGGSRLGAAVYNLGHSYPLPALTSLAGQAGHHPLVLAVGLLWLAHIGMDRMAGFGLKYDSGFRHTHLSDLAGTVRARSRLGQLRSGSLTASADSATGDSGSADSASAGSASGALRSTSEK